MRSTNYTGLYPLLNYVVVYDLGSFSKSVRAAVSPCGGQTNLLALERSVTPERSRSKVELLKGAEVKRNSLREQERSGNHAERELAHDC
jgi:hypothetical protein